MSTQKLPCRWPLAAVFWLFTAGGVMGQDPGAAAQPFSVTLDQSLLNGLLARKLPQAQAALALEDRYHGRWKGKGTLGDGSTYRCYLSVFVEGMKVRRLGYGRTGSARGVFEESHDGNAVRYRAGNGDGGQVTYRWVAEEDKDEECQRYAGFGRIDDRQRSRTRELLRSRAIRFVRAWQSDRDPALSGREEYLPDEDVSSPGRRAGEIAAEEADETDNPSGRRESPLSRISSIAVEGREGALVLQVKIKVSFLVRLFFSGNLSFTLVPEGEPGSAEHPSFRYTISEINGRGPEDKKIRALAANLRKSLASLNLEFAGVGIRYDKTGPGHGSLEIDYAALLQEQAALLGHLSAVALEGAEHGIRLMLRTSAP